MLEWIWKVDCDTLVIFNNELQMSKACITIITFLLLILWSQLQNLHLSKKENICKLGCLFLFLTDWYLVLIWRVYLCAYLLFSTDGMISIRLTIYNFQARLFGKLDFIQFWQKITDHTKNCCTFISVLPCGILRVCGWNETNYFVSTCVGTTITYL